SAKPGKEMFYLGNEAIVRGALESGVDLYSSYPGTPSSEIGEIFTEIYRDAGMKYCETSVNEKVAVEVAGAAYARGARAMVGMKNVGLNVASDAFFALSTTKPVNENSTLVAVVADDPEQHSSAVEMDSRYFLKLLNIPALEPCNPQECLDFTKEAFRISKKLKIPVILRTVTMVAHARSDVVIGELKKSELKNDFKLPKEVNVASRLYFLKLKEDQIYNRMHTALEMSEKSPLNKIMNGNIQNEYKLGIITSGVSYSYVVEALDFLDIKSPILKIGFINPLPENKIADFLEEFDQVLVVEENEPFIETQIMGIAQKHGNSVKIYGKDPFSYSKENELLPRVGELNPTMVILALSKITGVSPQINLELLKSRKFDVINRKPILCPGCPHRTTGLALKKAVSKIEKQTGKDVFYFQDIGCYTLLSYPPLGFANVKYCMGSSIGAAQGVAQTSNNSLNIAIIGDGTFFHAGLPALLNSIHNKAPILVLILDNGWIGMTGQQPNPGTNSDHYSEGRYKQRTSVENIIEGMGANVDTIRNNFSNKMKYIRKLTNLFIEAGLDVLNNRTTRVIVIKDECIQQYKKRYKPIIRFVDRELCVNCKTCYLTFGCPAIYVEDEKACIDATTCLGCGVCEDLCPTKAIKKVKS
ncbi:MAG: thiamine pyrophosphate-dependent enzyme, partial [Promethearchaeota archaeon]